jgi:hypothetical protein
MLDFLQGNLGLYQSRGRREHQTMNKHILRGKIKSIDIKCINAERKMYLLVVNAKVSKFTRVQGLHIYRMRLIGMRPLHWY